MIMGKFSSLALMSVLMVSELPVPCEEQKPHDYSGTKGTRSKSWKRAKKLAKKNRARNRKK
jgi:hypothetical protein